jgi:hypothetical protein
MSGNILSADDARFASGTGNWTFYDTTWPGTWTTMLPTGYNRVGTPAHGSGASIRMETLAFTPVESKDMNLVVSGVPAGTIVTCSAWVLQSGFIGAAALPIVTFGGPGLGGSDPPSSWSTTATTPDMLDQWQLVSSTMVAPGGSFTLFLQTQGGSTFPAGYTYVSDFSVSYESVRAPTLDAAWPAGFGFVQLVFGSGEYPVGTIRPDYPSYYAQYMSLAPWVAVFIERSEDGRVSWQQNERVLLRLGNAAQPYPSHGAEDASFRIRYGVFNDNQQTQSGTPLAYTDYSNVVTVRIPRIGATPIRWVEEVPPSNATHLAVGVGYRNHPVVNRSFDALFTRRIVSGGAVRWESQRTLFDGSDPNFIITDGGQNAVVGGFIHSTDNWDDSNEGFIVTTDGGVSWKAPDSVFRGITGRDSGDIWTSNGAHGNGVFVVGGFAGQYFPTTGTHPLPPNSRWVLVTGSDSDPMSPWQTTYVGNNNFYYLTFMDGQFVATGVADDDDHNITLHSYDGYTWTELVDPWPSQPPPGPVGTGMQLASDGTTWITTGYIRTGNSPYTITPTAYASTDQGHSWTQLPNPPVKFDAIAHHGGVWVAGHPVDAPVSGTTAPREHMLWYSDDGTNWNPALTDPFLAIPADLGPTAGLNRSWINEIHWDGERWFAMGTAKGAYSWLNQYEPFCVAAESTDGVNWTSSIPAQWDLRSNPDRPDGVWSDIMSVRTLTPSTGS